MTGIMPLAKPRQTKDETLEIGRGMVVGFDTKAWLLGIRGYYRDTMGVPGKNDRGIYDDAIILVSPTCHQTFNANTDPNVYRTGVAVLKTGLWLYKVGIHGLNKPADKRYPALVQAQEVTVIRDQQGPDTGYFGINIHRGSYTSTSSIGCQTIHPDQWSSFFESVKQEMKHHNQVVIPYLLVDGPTR